MILTSRQSYSSFNDSGLLNRNDALGPVNIWKLEDCIAVHKLLEDVFKDHGSASSKCTWIFQ